MHLTASPGILSNVSILGMLESSYMLLKCRSAGIIRRWKYLVKYLDEILDTFDHSSIIIKELFDILGLSAG